MLSKNFKEFIELLNEYNVIHLVVGGYAVALHGHPHYTKHLDIKKKWKLKFTVLKSTLLILKTSKRINVPLVALRTWLMQKT